MGNSLKKYQPVPTEPTEPSDPAKKWPYTRMTSLKKCIIDGKFDIPKPLPYRDTNADYDDTYNLNPIVHSIIRTKDPNNLQELIILGKKWGYIRVNTCIRDIDNYYDRQGDPLVKEYKEKLSMNKHWHHAYRVYNKKHLSEAYLMNLHGAKDLPESLTMPERIFIRHATKTNPYMC